jgi:hypothetical protein
MTTVMPRPFDQIKWGLESVSQALKQAEGQVTIPQDAARVFENFQRSFEPGTNQMREAMAQEIRWMSDGRTFPWSVEPGRTQAPKYDATERYHLRIASDLQGLYRSFAGVLDRADNDRNLNYGESQRLGQLVEALKTGVETLIDGVDNMREAKNNARPSYEIYETVKNAVNEIHNDTQGGPFGTLVKFGEREAQSFLDVMRYQVTNYEKQQEVVELLYDTAASPYGNMVLDQAAAEVFKNAWGHLGLDWAAAVDVAKEDHPIVALYAVAINSEIENGANNVRALESMLRAGEAAYSELGVSFVRNGPVALEGEVMPAASLALAGPAHRGERNQQVAELGKALDSLRAYIAELKAQG